jgi:hypothetical protein
MRIAMIRRRFAAIMTILRMFDKRYREHRGVSPQLRRHQ